MSKSAPPYLTLYVADFLADTMHLSAAGTGAYILILAHLWRHGARVDFDENELRQVSKVDARQWPKIWPTLRKFFTIEGGKITQKRLLSEHDKAVKLQHVRATNGMRGGRPKTLKDNDQPKATGSVSVKQSESESESSNLNVESQSQSAALDRPREAAKARGVTDEEFAHLVAASGPGLADPSKSEGLHTSRAEIGRWLRAGCDFELDVLPTIAARTARIPKSGPIRSWSWFTDAVIAARDARLNLESVEGSSLEHGKRNGEPVSMRPKSNSLAEAFERQLREAPLEPGDFEDQPDAKAG